MKINNFLFTLSSGILLALLTSSCDSLSSPDGKKKTSKIFPEHKEDFQTAIKFQRSGKYWDALKIYNVIKASAIDKRTDELAAIGASKCLIRLNKYDLALNALAPLSETRPKTTTERKKMAIAGEILLRKKLPVQAESTLELALSKLPDEDKNSLWTASVFCNLGKAYATNGKVEEAKMSYDIATHIFEKKDRKRAVEQCKKVSDALNQIIETHIEKNEIKKPLWEEFFK